jgi:hypothetical protein
VISPRRRSAPLAAVALAAACMWSPAAIGTQPAHAASYAWCSLSVREQAPPGGTPAYNLDVSRLNTSCRTAKHVMQDFHRCRTAAWYRCNRKVLRTWRCSATKDAGRPTFQGRFTCASGKRRVISTYQQDTPACFGAAARDPLLPCVNNTRKILGAPDGSWICDPGAVPGACSFGYLKPDAKGSFAIIGDSHVHHWRSALSVVAPIQKWRGYSLATGGCFFSEAVVRFMADCERWLRSTIQWFGAHPEVETVFVTGNADTWVGLAPGEDYLAVKVDGVRRALAQLPKTVKHVIVLRDMTITTQNRFDCVARTIREGRQRLATACPLARSVALRTDTAVEAVKGMRSPRYASIDLTRFVCGRRNCYPVVGGEYVNQDIWGHLDTTFMRSLGPYLLRDLRTLMASW